MDQDTITVALPDWVREILADPISKEGFSAANDKEFVSHCGFTYSYTQGVPDFRVRQGNANASWQSGQKHYEHWQKANFSRAEANAGYYLRQHEGEAPVFKAIPLTGRVLDVGGHLGFVREFMENPADYVSVDAFAGVHRMADGMHSMFKTYPALRKPLNLVWGFAEFLPFKSHSFDTVNMRSCIDHFNSPEIALQEAYRCLRPGGHVVIGIRLEDHSLLGTIKDFARWGRGIVFPSKRDHHLWHPTQPGLTTLCKSNGFEVEKEYWQTPEVLYVSCKKQARHMNTVESA